MQVAKIENNLVLDVIVADSVEWCINTFGGKWVRTYYNQEGKNFASINYIYYPDKDNFSSPQPYPSWILDDNCIWQAPIPYPNDGKKYFWDEQLQMWIPAPTENI
jgi:hypothetical protein